MGHWWYFILASQNDKNCRFLGFIHECCCLCYLQIFWWWLWLLIFIYRHVDGITNCWKTNLRSHFSSTTTKSLMNEIQQQLQQIICNQFEFYFTIRIHGHKSYVNTHLLTILLCSSFSFMHFQYRGRLKSIEC